MPVFQYTARTLKGDLQSGEVDLPTRDDVIAHLRKNRMVVVQVRAAPKAFKLSFKFGGGIKPRDLVVMARQFATMINAGLPLVQALDILAKQAENKSLAEITKSVVYDVESGHTLADAVRKHPKAFSDLYVNMVAAGEAGGILDTILVRLSEFLEKNDAIIRKVKGAMIYPAVIMSVAAIAIAVLLIFVIPTFQNMFASVNLELPLPTRIVIGMSSILTHYWWAMIGAVGGFVFLLSRWYKTAPGRLQIDKLLLRLPVLEDAAHPDHDAGGEGQLQVHRGEHVLERRDHEDEQHRYGDARDGHDHRGVDHGALHLADDGVILLQELRQAHENRVENAARLARGDHVDVQVAEGLGVLAQRVREGVAALDVVHDRFRDFGAGLVLGLLREDVERLHQRHSGVDHGRELPGHDHEIAGLDAAAEAEA